MVQIDAQQTSQTPHGQMNRRIFRATGALMIIQGILRFFGAIEKSILGYTLGTDYRADAYNAAKDIAFYLFQMVDQVVMHSFLPVFVQRMRDHGERDAWKLASTTINLLIAFLAVIAAVGMLFTPQILPLFVPNWFNGASHVDPRLIPLLTLLTRMMLIAVIFLATSSLTYCLLNSYKQFALPASADLVLKSTVVVLAVFFVGGKWGPIALAAGFVIGSIAKVAVHATGLRGRLQYYRPTIDFKDQGLKQFGVLALPLFIGVIISIGRQAMDQRFTSSLSEGSLSALKYAKNLCDIPVQFFPFVFGIALFPFLADIAAAGDRVRLRAMLMSATRMMILIFVPLAVLLIMLREPIVLTLFSSKSMRTTEPLQVYALTMLASALEIIVLQFYFAMSDTIKPTVVGIIMVALHITVAYLAIYHWHIGIIGIPLALLISKGTKVTVLYAMIREKLGTLEGARTLALAGKVVMALIPLFTILWLTVTHLPAPTEVAGKLHKLLALLPYGVAAGMGTIAYFAVLHFSHVDEVSLLVAKVRGKLKRTPTTA